MEHGRLGNTNGVWRGQRSRSSIDSQVRNTEFDMSGCVLLHNFLLPNRSPHPISPLYSYLDIACPYKHTLFLISFSAPPLCPAALPKVRNTPPIPALPRALITPQTPRSVATSLHVFRASLSSPSRSFAVRLYNFISHAPFPAVLTPPPASGRYPRVTSDNVCYRHLE